MMKKLYYYTGLLFLGFLLLVSPSVFAQGNTSSSAIKTSDDGTDYVIVGKAFHDIFSEPTMIDLNQNKTVYFQQEIIVNQGTMSKYLAKFINQDATGNSWFQFTSYPTVTKGNAKLTYTTDGINFSETLPELSDLLGYKMELTQNIVHPEDETNLDADLLISFTMAPKKATILENGALGRDIVPFSGGYDSGGYGTYYDWRFGRGVNFTNTPIPAEAVEVVYEDENGMKIHDSQIIEGNIDEEYDAGTEQYKVEIPGYTLNQDKLPQNTIGHFTDQKQVVTYVYSKDPVKAADVTVNYQDTTGHKLTEDIVLSGMLGEQYITEQKEVDGYVFQEVQGNKSGLFTEEPQTVSYIYTKTAPKKSTITIKYEDSTGNKLADDILESGIIGEVYNTEQKEIVGYTFKEVIGRPKGIFMDENQIITYIYEKNVIQNFSNKTSNSYKLTTPISTSTLPRTGENDRNSANLAVIGSLLAGFVVTVLLRSNRKKWQE